MVKRGAGFTLIELLIAITIIGILSNIGLNTFTSSQQKGRDTKRKTALRQVADALETYYNDKGQYPDDDDGGNIEGCGVDALEACTYGTSAFSNTTTGTVYMVKLPGDPVLGNTYHYEAFKASGKVVRYQLYARLENLKDAAINKDADDQPLVFQGVYCGTNECNYGISSSNTSADTGRTLATE